MPPAKNIFSLQPHRFYETLDGLQWECRGNHKRCGHENIQNY